MTRHVYDQRGETLIRKEEADPTCGKDFCDRCGDCLACFGCGCIEGGECFWVKYGE